METPLLQTKLYIPPIQSDLVPRLRLIELLNEGPHGGRKLTLISAPAGFGKTTLLSEWINAGLWNRKYGVSSKKDHENDPIHLLNRPASTKGYMSIQSRDRSGYTTRYLRLHQM